jgi:hypothetical protein
VLARIAAEPAGEVTVVKPRRSGDLVAADLNMISCTTDRRSWREVYRRRTDAGSAHSEFGYGHGTALRRAIRLQAQLVARSAPDNEAVPR